MGMPMTYARGALAGACPDGVVLVVLLVDVLLLGVPLAGEAAESWGMVLTATLPPDEK
jgi:hypothetical protein